MRKHTHDKQLNVETSCVSLLHMSDLHFSDASDPDYVSPAYSENLMAQIPKAVDIDRFSRVIVSGDVSNWGSEEGLRSAKNWLMSNGFGVSGERVGLNLSPPKLQVVPGNHDAWDGKKSKLTRMFGTPLTANIGFGRSAQVGIGNFNHVFSEYQYMHPGYCRMDWVPMQDSGILLIYLCSAVVSRKTARFIDLRYVDPRKYTATGLVTEQQCEMMYDMLYTARREGMVINDHRVTSEMIQKSLKIAVMHHYLYDSPGKGNRGRQMELEDRESVSRNLVLCGCNILLAGHQHIQDWYDFPRQDMVDARAAARLFWNEARLAVGLRPGRRQGRTRDGVILGKSVSAALEVVMTARTNPDCPAARFLEAVRQTRVVGEKEMGILRDLVKDIFLAKGLVGGKETDLTEQIAMAEALTNRAWTPEVLDALKSLGTRIANHRSRVSRSRFAQGMSGASTKAGEENGRQRGFFVYDLDYRNNAWLVTPTAYTWHPLSKQFQSNRLKSVQFDHCW